MSSYEQQKNMSHLPIPFPHLAEFPHPFVLTQNINVMPPLPGFCLFRSMNRLCVSCCREFGGHLPICPQCEQWLRVARGQQTHLRSRF